MVHDVLHAKKKLITNTSIFIQIGEQEDAREFLEWIMNRLVEQYDTQRATTYSTMSVDEPPIRRVQVDTVVTTVTQMSCLSCGAVMSDVTDTSQSFLHIQVPPDFGEPVPLSTFFNCTFGQENIEYTATCCSCGVSCRRANRQAFISPGASLVLSLGRCRSDGQKILTRMACDEIVDLRDWCVDGFEACTLYRVDAIVNHNGINVHRGHYTCQVRSPSGHWYCVDDSAVLPIDAPTENLGESISLLLLTRVEQNTPSAAAADGVHTSTSPRAEETLAAYGSCAIAAARPDSDKDDASSATVMIRYIVFPIM